MKSRVSGTVTALSLRHCGQKLGPQGTDGLRMSLVLCHPTALCHLVEPVPSDSTVLCGSQRAAGEQAAGKQTEVLPAPR